MERASMLQPDAPETRLARGYYRYWGSRDYVGALEEFDAALRSRPADAEIVEAIGLIQRRQGRWVDALTTLEHASDLEPHSMSIGIDAAETACLMRRYSVCARYADRVNRVAPDAVLGYSFRAEVQEASGGDMRTAQRIIHEGLAGPNREGLLFVAGWFIARFGTPEDREALLAVRVDAFGSDTAGYYAVKGDASRVAGDRGRARAYYDSMRTFDEGRTRRQVPNSQAHSSLGYAYANLGRRADAVREGRRATELLPVSRDAFEGADRMLNLAIIYGLVGDRDAAVEQLRALLKVPSWVSPGDLRTNPDWALLRDDPRFQQLANQSLLADSQ
jgi:serine/threonine-protein kinase